MIARRTRPSSKVVVAAPIARFLRQQYFQARLLVPCLGAVLASCAPMQESDASLKVFAGNVIQSVTPVPGSALPEQVRYPVRLDAQLEPDVAVDRSWDSYATHGIKVDIDTRALGLLDTGAVPLELRLRPKVETAPGTVAPWYCQRRLLRVESCAPTASLHLAHYAPSWSAAELQGLEPAVGRHSEDRNGLLLARTGHWELQARLAPDNRSAARPDTMPEERGSGAVFADCAPGAQNEQEWPYRAEFSLKPVAFCDDVFVEPVDKLTERLRQALSPPNAAWDPEKGYAYVSLKPPTTLVSDAVSAPIQGRRIVRSDLPQGAQLARVARCLRDAYNASQPARMVVFDRDAKGGAPTPLKAPAAKEFHIDQIGHVLFTWAFGPTSEVCASGARARLESAAYYDCDGEVRGGTPGQALIVPVGDNPIVTPHRTPLTERRGLVRWFLNRASGQLYN